jgi:DNA-binding beta-propeller fold protein YncE
MESPVEPLHGAHEHRVIVSIDGHTILRDGKQIAAPGATADTVAVVDLSRYPPQVVDAIPVPGSVVGPPMAVAVARDGDWAVVTSATRVENSVIVPDDRVSVIDLASSPIRIVQSLQSGAGATAARFTPDMKLALVTNRAEGTVSVFAVRDRRLRPIAKLDLENAKSRPSALSVLPDGKAALLSRDGDHMISVLHIEGEKVSLDPRPITAGIRPYALDINAAGTLAAVSNMGRGDGDVDSVTLIDLTTKPFRTVGFFTVPSGPEGLKFSPDGAFLAVVSQNGTTKPPGSTFHGNRGSLLLLAVDGQNLRKVAEAPIGGWSQGVAFSRDGEMILVCNMIERNLSVFLWRNGELTETDPLALESGPAAMGTSWD